MRKTPYFVAAFVLVAITLACFYMQQSSRDELQRRAQDLLSPPLRLAGWLRSLYSGVDDGFISAGEERGELRRLRDLNARLATENSLLRDLGAENTRLREMVGYKKASPFQLLACRVVGRDPSTWWNTVLINRGWKDDKLLTSDLPVVSPRGLVGKTGIVSPSVTEVILLADENCKISANTESSREQGILVGEGKMNEGKSRMRMKFISRNASLAIGERVFTSGLGGVFPPGLFLGTVIDVPALSASENFGLYREAVIEPAVDLTQLDELFIVLSVK